MVRAFSLDGRCGRALVADFWRGLFPGGYQACARHAFAGAWLENPQPAGICACCNCQPPPDQLKKRFSFSLIVCILPCQPIDLVMNEVPNTPSPVVIYTDGACKGNPGPGGWGALLNSGGTSKEIFGGELGTTNNRMEIMAVIEALSALKRPCHVTLHLDSEYVLKGITEWIHGWKARGWRTAAKAPVKNVDLWQRLDAVVSTSGHQIDWRWVRGHAGDPGNERADALANKGVEMALGNGRTDP